MGVSPIESMFHVRSRYIHQRNSRFHLRERQAVLLSARHSRKVEKIPGPPRVEGVGRGEGLLGGSLSRESLESSRVSILRLHPNGLIQTDPSQSNTHKPGEWLGPLPAPGFHLRGLVPLSKPASVEEPQVQVCDSRHARLGLTENIWSVGSYSPLACHPILSTVAGSPNLLPSYPEMG